MWFLHPPKSRRRWHVFTWLAALPALVFVALVQIAGVEDSRLELLTVKPYWTDQVDPYSGGGAFSIPGTPLAPVETDADWVTEYLHGWPTPWLRRAVEFGGPGGITYHNLCGATTVDPPWRLRGHTISWSSPYAWPLTSDATRLYPLGITVNLLVMACLVGVLMLATETWLRRRGGFPRFKIIDFLVVVAVCAAGFGLWHWDRAIVEREQSALAKRDVIPNSVTAPQYPTGYIGPEWASRLCGHPQVVPILQRVVALETDCANFIDFDPESLSPFRSLRRVSIGLQATSTTTHLSVFNDCRQIRELSLYRSYLGGYWESPPEKYDLAFLEGLSHIETLEINLPLLLEDLAVLDAMSGLEELHLRSDWLTDREFVSLQARLPHVRISSLPLSEKPAVRDVQIALCRFDRQHRGKARGEVEADAFSFQLPERSALSDDGTALLLTHVPLSPKLQEILRPALPQITSLNLKEVEIPGETHRMIAAMTSLEMVEIRASPVPDELMLQLAKCPQLQFVTLAHSRVALDPLLEFKHRAEVEIELFGYCGLGIDDLQELGRVLGERFISR